MKLQAGIWTVRPQTVIVEGVRIELKRGPNGHTMMDVRVAGGGSKRVVFNGAGNVLRIRELTPEEKSAT